MVRLASTGASSSGAVRSTAPPLPTTIRRSVSSNRKDTGWCSCGAADSTHARARATARRSSRPGVWARAYPASAVSKIRPSGATSHDPSGRCSETQ
ncbi:hypothetical protein [Nannocystis pusilla]|uniref:hypothetical protein n=1 Tax=Nannocystis pusilla TaxID=889268 RepID=UPI003B7D214F